MIRVQYLLECYTGETLLELSEDNLLERSSESEEHADWNFFLASNNILPVFEDQDINARDDVLNFRMRQNIRSLARKLRNAADSLSVRPGSALLSVERAILLTQGLNQDEMKVVKNILSERTPTTVSRIAEHLGNYLSSHTFHAALRYLSYSVATPLEELALSCELIKVIYPKIKEFSHSNLVYNAINNFIDDRLDGVLH